MKAVWWFVHAESDEERASPIDERITRLDRLSVEPGLPLTEVNVNSEDKWAVLEYGLKFWHGYLDYARSFPERLPFDSSKEDGSTDLRDFGAK